jgi:tetratricopeptide (TPR) repeat protein
MNTDSYLLRARVLMSQNRMELAEEQLRMVLASESSHSEAHAMLALCLVEREAWDAANEEAQQAIFHGPEEPMAHYSFARVLLKRNRLREAREAINEALRLSPWNADYFATLGAIEAAGDKWEEVLKAAQQGLEAEPEHEACENLRAAALTTLGRRSEAGLTIQESLRRNPENAFTHANEGWRLLHVRQPEQAMVHFREALRLDPNMEWARRGIVEAMKARFFIYRMMLGFFLWIGRFPPGTRLLLLIGMPIAQSVLQTTVASVPALEFLAFPMMLTYLLFVWMTWTSSALFNLVLMLNPFGRLALNREEKVQAIATGSCVAAALVCEILFLYQSLKLPEILSHGTYVAALYLGLAVPVITTTSTTERRRKLAAAAWTLLVLYFCLSTTFRAWRFSEIAITTPEPTPIPTEMEAAFAPRKASEPLKLNVPPSVDEPTKKEWIKIQQEHNDYMEKLRAPGKEFGSQFSNTVTLLILSTWMGLALMMIPVRR